MDETVFSGLFAPVGVISLFVFMVRMVWVWLRGFERERLEWQQRERTILEDHRKELNEKREHRLAERAALIAEHQAAMAAATADLQQHIEWLRARVIECQAELDTWRGHRDGGT